MPSARCTKPDGWRRLHLPRLLAILLLITAPGAPEATAFMFKKGAKWRDISPEEMALAAPRIDPEAGAEILIADISVDDSSDNATLTSNYVRIKVFDRKGVELLDKIDLEYVRGRGNTVRDVAARVVLPDGTVRELEQGDLFEREVVRYGDVRVNVKSFSFPGIEPGCIIEYQYQAVQYGGSAHGMRLCLQDRFPIHYLRLRVKPYTRYQSHIVHANTGSAKVEKVDGYQQLKLRDVPAFERAPFPPPRDVIEPWFRLTYTYSQNLKDPDAFWKARAERLYEHGRTFVTPNNRRVRAVVAEETQGINSDEAKLQVLYTYMQRKVANLSYDSHGYTIDELSKLKDNETAADVLARGYGYATEINATFAALAAAAGYEARLAAVTNRARTFFHRSMHHHDAISYQLAAVNVGGAWRFFDPGDPFLPCGMLDWINSDGHVLLAHNKEVQFVPTPPAQAGESRILNRAELTLRADGTLAGDVRITCTGHEAVYIRRNYENLAGAKLAEKVANNLGKRLPRALVSKAVMENERDLVLPVTIAYHVEIPGYADVAGSRLFVNPSMFRHNAAALFPEQNRSCSIYFRYPWEEDDTVNIALPEGYTIENGEMPKSLGDCSAIVHSITIGMLRDGRLALRRKFRVNSVLIPADQYPAVKLLFDTLSGIDGHLLTLIAPSAGMASTAAPSE
jgi:hypothetical protein